MPKKITVSELVSVVIPDTNFSRYRNVCVPSGNDQIKLNTGQHTSAENNSTEKRFS